MSSQPNLVTIDLDASEDAASQSSAEVVADGLLAALDRSKTKATFFVPRSIAESKAPLARRIAEAGHEVACLSNTRPARERPYAAAFSDELQTARGAIEDATGVRVRGHRNAPFAVDRSSEWAYDVLVDQGFEYDSSRLPARYPEPGFDPVPRHVHAVRRWNGTLLEIPVSTADVLSMRMQLGTTETIRGIPLPVWRALVESRQLRGEPLVMHLRASALRRQSMFGRTAPFTADAKTLDRVSGIVGQFPFTSVVKAFPELLRLAPVIEN